MPRYFECPYLGSVELTDEREGHILDVHPQLLPAYWAELTATLRGPDLVIRKPGKARERQMVRWFQSVLGGRNVVVVVVSDQVERGWRHWVVTAYPSRKQPPGVVEWRSE